MNLTHGHRLVVAPFFRQSVDWPGRLLVSSGVEMCRQECPYFAFCGGSAPANKFFENGTFASTETMSCRLQKQVCLDVTLAWLENHRPVLSQASEPTHA